MENSTTIAIDLSKGVGVQWELRPVLALGDQRFAFALPLDPRPPRSEPSTRGSARASRRRTYTVRFARRRPTSSAR